MKVNKKTNNIFLVGLPGSGKSTLGLVLAQHLHKQFFDADTEVERLATMSVADIMAAEGEAGFRQREMQVIAELTGKQNIVLATGGGAVLNINNRSALKNNGVVIYLYAAIDELITRISHNNDRPLFFNQNPNDVLMRLSNERESFYREIADLSYDTSSYSMNDLVNKITSDL